MADRTIADVISRQRLDEILLSIGRTRIAVLGDFCLDIYWDIDMTRAELSRETPLYTRPVFAERFSPGASSNVAWNLCDLGAGAVHAVGLFGGDWRGTELRALLDHIGVTIDHVVTNPDRMTPAFTKPMLRGFHTQMEDARIDFRTPDAPDAADERRIIEQLERVLDTVDALVVGDQVQNGIMTTGLRHAISAAGVKHPKLIIVADSRDHVADFTDVIVKPNDVEATRVFEPDAAPDDVTVDKVERYGRQLRERTGRPVCVTVGKRGAYVFDSDVRHVPGARVEPPTDIVGAGDTFISAFAASLAAGAELAEAAALANLASSVSISKLGQTGTAAPDEIRHRYDEQERRR